MAASTEGGRRSNCTPFRWSAADEEVGVGSPIAASRDALYASASARKRAGSAALATSLRTVVVLARQPNAEPPEPAPDINPAPQEAPLPPLAPPSQPPSNDADTSHEDKDQRGRYRSTQSNTEANKTLKRWRAERTLDGTV